MTATSFKDPLGYYAVLNVTPASSEDDIKQNYRDQAKLWHPDHNSGEEAKDRFQKISVAYDILTTAEKRLTYDLLSQVYETAKFPEMFALKIYKDRRGREDVNVRAVSVWKVVGRLLASDSRKSDEVCTYSEAVDLELKTSVSNWLLGWWGLKAAPQNFAALVYNFQKAGCNRQANLQLLIHNALAYAQEKQKEKAWLSARGALEFADPYQKQLLQKFMDSLGVQSSLRLRAWNYQILRLVQLIVPALVVLLIIVPLLLPRLPVLNIFSSAGDKSINYYQEVNFRSGDKTVNDLVVSKVLNIPVNREDNSKLYHLRRPADIMFGPAENFDVMATLGKGTTVRITGVSPDQTWYRIMLDDGNMGFVRREDLKPGIGKEIPLGSKLIK